MGVFEYQNGRKYRRPEVPSHRAELTVLSKAALEPSMPVSMDGHVPSATSRHGTYYPLHCPPRTQVKTLMVCSSETAEGWRFPGKVVVVGGGDALIFSSSSSILSCCRRSFAHLANSSWLLVALRSFRTVRYRACSSRWSRICFEVPSGVAM